MAEKQVSAAMNKDVLAIGGLLLTLFLLMIIVAIVFIGADELKEVACETNTATYEWNESSCKTAANTAATVQSVTQIVVIEGVVIVVLGLLTLVVIVGLFAIVIKAGMGFAKSF